MCWLCNFRMQQFADGEVAATPFRFEDERATDLASPSPSDLPPSDTEGVKPPNQATAVSNPPPE